MPTYQFSEARLKPEEWKQRKASDDLRADIAKDRLLGLTYRQLAEKYNTTFSICYTAANLEKRRETSRICAKKKREAGLTDMVKKNLDRKKRRQRKIENPEILEEVLDQNFVLKKREYMNEWVKNWKKKRKNKND